jgi:hypothetical protein
MSRGVTSPGVMSRGVKLALAGLAVAAALAVFSPLASDRPDGLEAVMERLGVAEVATPTIAAPIPDYGEDGGATKKILAGLLGTALVFGLTLGLGAALKRRRTT